MKRLVPTLLVVLGFTSCDPPPAFPGADKRQNVRAARIEGTVVVSSVARGRVALFLYDAARPPPPVGTGRPLTFAVLSREAVFKGAADGDVGPFTAPYAFSLVAPGRYLVRAFIDANDDFIPWYGVTSEVNTGDVGGAAVDPVTRASRIIEVTVDADEHPVAVVNVPVSISDTARVPVDRPVFALPTTLTLGATPLAVNVGVYPLSSDLVQERTPVFLARLVDDDGDGVPDDANHDGVPDFWPRVVVRKLAGDGSLADENDLDRNGLLDTEAGFADYEHINTTTNALIAPDGAPDLVVLAAGFDFSALAAQLVDGTGRVKATPTPVGALKLVIQPRAIDASNAAAPQVLSSVPKGRYAVTIIQSTGQTWRVPNELAPEFAAARGFPEAPSQAFVVEVP